MSILFGHPAGNPNSHQAALAHFERGRLAAFCVPWMPTPRELAFFRSIPGLGTVVERLARRSFPPLMEAPRVEGRRGEWGRMVRRFFPGGFFNGEHLAYEANDWLEQTMARECQRQEVLAVHSYEDCSLQCFREANRLGKACFYDMPIGHIGYWERLRPQLVNQFPDWVGPWEARNTALVRPLQKREELERANLILAPSKFARDTLLEHGKREVVVAPYGVDSAFWNPGDGLVENRKLRVIYAGQMTLRKGIPLLLQAWKRAELRDAELVLVGSWQLADSRRRDLPSNVVVVPTASPLQLRDLYRSADLFVFPSYFEGYGLVLTEALACGVPVLTTTSTVGPDILNEASGRIISPGDQEALTATLRSLASERTCLASMRTSARTLALKLTWKAYRDIVSVAVAPFVS